MCNMGFYNNPCADELLVSSFHSFEARIANANCPASNEYNIISEK